MPAVTSQLYQETLKRFDKAMNQEEQNLIIEQYNLLKEMLHPENPLRKLLSMAIISSFSKHCNTLGLCVVTINCV